MKYLYIPPDDSPSENEVESWDEVDQEHLREVDCGEAEVVRWNQESGRFEAVLLETVEAEGDDEEDELRICGWRWL